MHKKQARNFTVTPKLKSGINYKSYEVKVVFQVAGVVVNFRDQKFDRQLKVNAVKKGDHSE